MISFEGDSNKSQLNESILNQGEPFSCKFQPCAVCIGFFWGLLNTARILSDKYNVLKIENCIFLFWNLRVEENNNLDEHRGINQLKPFPPFLSIYLTALKT